MIMVEDAHSKLHQKEPANLDVKVNNRIMSTIKNILHLLYEKY